MTDREQFLALLDRFGVGYECSEKPTENGWIEAGDPTRDVVIPQGAGERNVGYMWFYTRVEFDDNDAFLRVGAWE